MKNPKPYIILLLVILIFLVFYLLKSKNKEIVLEEPLENKKFLDGSSEYTFDPSLSQVVWQGKKTFISNWIDEGFISLSSGGFKTEEGIIKEGSLIIDMNSISANKTGSGNGQNMLTNHLKSADFFDVENFKTSKFVITSVKNLDNINYLLTGDLTIKNITKSIEAPVSVYQEDEKIYIVGDVIVDRSSFDVRFGSSNFFQDLGDKTIDNEFTLKLNLVAIK
jgi:polyisoprenoid-binding protein YceI